MRQVAVMGGGAWATACAQVLADAGNEVYLWARDEKVVQDINENRHNSKFHPNVKLSSRIKASSNPEEVENIIDKFEKEAPENIIDNRY